MPPTRTARPLCDVCCDRRACGDACARCQFHTCRACARRWALEDPSGDASARCPSCASPWDVHEERARLGAAFVAGAWRAERRRRLARQETPLLRRTAPLARRELRRRALRQRLRQVGDEIVRMARDEPGRLDESLLALQRALHRSLDAVERAPLAPPSSTRCAHGGCVGYVEAGVCGTCGEATCDRCGAAVVGAHACDETAVASRAAVAAQCRPCPSCGAPSLRAEGCPVMWCAGCHAFWHWDTGRLLDARRGAPHNPDHRAWLARTRRATARELDDIPCGGVPDDETLRWPLMREVSRFGAVDPRAPEVPAACAALWRAQALRRAYPRDWSAERANEALRLALLTRDIDESQFAVRVERDDRTRRFKRDVGDVLEAFVLAGADVLQRFVADDGGDGFPATMAAVALELHAVRSVVDAALADLARAHGRTAPRLGAQWRWNVPGRAGGDG